MAEGTDAGDGPAGYSSYLLRLWRFERGGEVAWRVSATRTDSGREVVLTGFEELIEYLHREAESPAVGCGKRVQDQASTPIQS